MPTELFVDPGTELVRAAVISDDGLYRYRLSRSWAPGRTMVWVMLNPSTADAEVDDPTIRRCMSFARREGCGGIEVINLYALRATKPKHLLDTPDPEGPDNIRAWAAALTDPRVQTVVAAWGAHCRMPGLTGSRAYWVQGMGRPMHCLGWTKAGDPRHPLYVRADEPLVRFSAHSESLPSEQRTSDDSATLVPETPGK